MTRPLYSRQGNHQNKEGTCTCIYLYMYSLPFFSLPFSPLLSPLPLPSLSLYSHDELVDIIEEEVTNDGGADNIQNMLSSIVYSLGLGDQEVHEAMKNWHRRNILPPIDNNLLWYDTCTCTCTCIDTYMYVSNIYICT